MTSLYRCTNHLVSLVLAAALSGCIAAEGELLIDVQSMQQSGIETARIELFAFEAELAGGDELTCASLTGGEVDVELLDSLVSMAFRIGPAPGGDGDADGDVDVAILDEVDAIGNLPPGATVFYALARGDDCSVVAEGCTQIELRSGDKIEVPVTMRLASPPELCWPHACHEGFVCGPCTGDEGCDDFDPCTVDICDLGSGECGIDVGTVALDADGDTHAPDSCEDGTDCDDTNEEIYPGADRQCGFAVDHDCDGQVDDLQGCPHCANATGLQRVGTIDTPAVSLFVIGTSPDGGGQELFLGTPEALEVYTIDEDGTATLTGSTPYEGALPLAPAVIGDYVLIVDGGSSGLWIYEIDALRAGNAEAVTRLDEVALGVGQVTALAAGTRYAYLSLSAGGGALAALRLEEMPEILPERDLVRALDSGEWRDSDALALDTGDGGGLFGVLGSELSYVGLDETGAIVAGSESQTDIDEGFGTDLDLLTQWVVMARGSGGLMLVARQAIEDGMCCSSGDKVQLRLPAGCATPVCEADGVCDCRCPLESNPDHEGESRHTDPDCHTIGCGDDGICNLGCPRSRSCSTDAECPSGSPCRCDCVVDAENCGPGGDDVCCSQAVCDEPDYPEHCEGSEGCACEYDPNCGENRGCGCPNTGNVAVVDEGRAVAVTSAGFYDAPGASPDIAPLRVYLVDISNPSSMSILDVQDATLSRADLRPADIAVAGDFVYVSAVDQYFNLPRPCSETEPCEEGRECICVEGDEGETCECSLFGAVDIFRLVCD